MVKDKICCQSVSRYMAIQFNFYSLRIFFHLFLLLLLLCHKTKEFCVGNIPTCSSSIQYLNLYFIYILFRFFCFCFCFQLFFIVLCFFFVVFFKMFKFMFSSAQCWYYFSFCWPGLYCKPAGNNMYKVFDIYARVAARNIL